MRVGIVVCNFNYHENRLPPWLFNVLMSIKNQRTNFPVDVLVVDNSSGSNFLARLQEFCSEYSFSSPDITFSCISESKHYHLFESINLGFYIFKTRNKYDALIYSSDDVRMHDVLDLQNLMKEFNNPQVGVVAAQVNKDNAERSYHHLQPDISGKSRILRLWECVNLHFWLFSHEYLELYDYRYPDFMYGFSSESLIPFTCAAIRKKFLLSRAVMLYNEKSKSRVRRKKQTKGHPNGAFIMPVHAASLREVLEPGYAVGLGFNLYNRNYRLPLEKVHGGFWMDYNPKLYDKCDNCQDPEALYEYIKENLFLRGVDYEKRISESHIFLDNIGR